MTEIRFYHLQQDTTIHAVPELLSKATSRNLRVLLKLPDQSRVDFYDDWLWRYKPESFLPHGREGDPHGDVQPIWLGTADQTPNKATMVLAIENAPLPPAGSFDLLCLMFDSEHKDRLDAARALWSKFKKQPDLTLTYWKQQDNGSWAKQD